MAKRIAAHMEMHNVHPSLIICNIPVAYNHQPFFSLSPKNDPLSFPFIRQCILTCSLSFPVVFPFISAFLALTWFFPKTVVLPRLSFVPSLCRVTQPTPGSTTIQQQQANKQFKQHVRNQRQQA
jgi:hypothetical protein